MKLTSAAVEAAITTATVRARIGYATGRPSVYDRPALPAGHPTTWGLITDGTVLDGAVYPHPVFNFTDPYRSHVRETRKDDQKQFNAAKRA